MTRPRLLDLFCGAGGAAMGYHQAGFDVVGVDIEPQPRYPFEFWQLDAIEVMNQLIRGGDLIGGFWPYRSYDFAAVHASPPCPRYSTLGAMWNVDRDSHPDLYEATRARLQATGLPWVIENVPGAPYRQGVVLCGSMFGLAVRRHRNFESSLLMLAPACQHTEQGQPLGVYGTGGGGQMTRGRKATRQEAPAAMGIDWMTPAELSQAIPPAYTRWIGEQLLAAVTPPVPVLDPHHTPRSNR